MNYASPERQRIARLNALGVKADKFILDNGIQLPARPVQFNHDQPIEVMSGPPPGHPAALPYFDDGYTGGVPDDGYGQQVVVSEPPAEPKVHPLAKFIDYETTGRIEPVIYVIDEVLEQAITLIAGAAGAGKTTQLVPVFARCTHLVNNTELLPLLRRKVIYVAEDPRQVIRIVTSMRLSGAITCPDEDFHHWFRIVKAKRLEPVEIVKVVAEYAGLFTTNVGSDGVTRYEAPPVVVFDTAAATFRLENENDNAQVSACISALKDHFGNIPVVIVAHTAKALRTCSRSPEQKCQESEMDELQVGVELSLAVLP